MTSTAYPTDIGILVVFLGVNLAVGLGYDRSVKTLRDYAWRGKNFSTNTLVATTASGLPHLKGWYVIPVNVREVRPQTMDTLVSATTAEMSNTTIYPKEEAVPRGV